MRTTLITALFVSLGFATGACSGLIGDSHQLDGIDDEDDFGDDDPLGCDIIVTLARSGCTQSGCHGATYKGNLDLGSPDLPRRLINVRSTTASCAGELLVDPANIADSLILKVTDPDQVEAGGVCTMLMPLNHDPMTIDDRACLGTWVQQIVDDWTPPDVLVFEPMQPESYVAKVKTLLTGEAMTEVDLDTVNGDPKQLRTLANGWMNHPAFTKSLADFFANTLQAHTDTLKMRQLFGIRGARIIRANGLMLPGSAEESVTHTAVDIVTSGRPFTEVVTTHRWWVNTALLMAIGFMDEPAGDWIATSKRHTVQRGTTPLPLAQSVSTKTWVFPELPADCNITKLSEMDLFQALLGTLLCTPTLTYPDTAIIKGTDFTDWRYVDFVTGNPTVPWYDVPAMRSATTLTVRNPRVGFFKQLAFLSNWITNDDNKFRATINQTLIAALDASFSAGDPTGGADGPLPNKIDTDHAAKGTECYGCHRLMDPMRGYFSANEATDYTYEDNSSGANAAFAFLGHQVAQRGVDIDTFASSLTDHPRFALAWTQKLCMFATSHRCDESDPEVQRIAALFAKDFDFKKLMLELVTSPLVTQTREVQTFETTDPFISISRRNHLCSVLEARTGVAGICAKSTVAKALALVPDDDYTRGEVDLVQTTQTSPFHVAASKQLCAAVAPFAVTSTSTSYPSRAANLPTLIVERFLGLPVGHSRHAAAVEALATHIEDAQKPENGAAAIDIAARSAFVAACLSSDILSIGM